MIQQIFYPGLKAELQDYEWKFKRRRIGKEKEKENQETQQNGN